MCLESGPNCAFQVSLATYLPLMGTIFSDAHQCVCACHRFPTPPLLCGACLSRLSALRRLYVLCDRGGPLFPGPGLGKLLVVDGEQRAVVLYAVMPSR